MQMNKEAFKEFARGVSFTIVVLGVLALLIAIFGTPNEEPVEKFKVVDKYNDCNVVRYGPDGGARYSYFLDCGR